MEVILMTRLYAMYQQSRKMLVFSYCSFTRCHNYLQRDRRNGTQGYDNATGEPVLSNTYQCNRDYGGDAGLDSTAWILYTAWEVLTLCLVVWIAVKHFRSMHRPLAGWTIGDCFAVLIKTHVAYFASFVTVSCFQLGFLSPGIIVRRSFPRRHLHIYLSTKFASSGS
ncbi:hypothetical protein EDB19DRAFT_690627 [Suillus lakei]|nr:hypothetical protein EDB19DRAFT_690627 [Suillus lakei]